MTAIDPPLLQKSRPAQVVQQLRQPRHGPAIVAATAAEATRTPGLVITPALDQDITGAWSFTGDWTVRHQHSGLVVISGGPGAGLGHARDLAALLGEMDVDWTRPREQLPLRDTAVRTAVGELHEQIQAAIGDARPARLLDTSWQQIPPPYWIGLHRGDAAELVGSFTAAADFLARIAVDEPGLGWNEAVIGRDPAPWWDLHCAAPDCRSPLADGEVGWMPHRADLADIAHDEGWRRLDPKRWLCATCSALFTPTRPH